MEVKLNQVLIQIVKEGLGRGPKTIEIPRTPSERENLLQLAKGNGLVPHVITHLIDSSQGKEKLHYEQNLAVIGMRNELMKKEVKRLAAAFKTKQIPAVFFGGVVTASSEELQMPADIDILVKKKDRQSVRRIIQRFGYRLRQDISPKSWEMEFGKKIPFPIEIDLHWKLTYPTHGNLNPLNPSTIESLTREFMESAREMPWEGTAVTAPTSENLLMYQILHFFFNHKARGLKRIYDITKTINAGTVNWEVFLEKIKKTELKNFAYFVFILAQDIFSVRPPKGIMQALKPKHLLFPLAMKFSTPRKICNPYPERNAPETVVRMAGVEKTLLLFLIYDKPLFWKLRFLLRPFFRPKLFLSLNAYLRLLLKGRDDIRTGFPADGPNRES